MKKTFPINEKNHNDIIKVADNVINKIVQEVIQENKNLFVDKTYLNLKNDKSIKVTVEQQTVTISLDVNVNYGRNINTLITELQKEIKTMVEHITEYQVSQVNMNIVGIEA